MTSVFLWAGLSSLMLSCKTGKGKKGGFLYTETVLIGGHTSSKKPQRCSLFPHSKQHIRDHREIRFGDISPNSCQRSLSE